MLMVAQTLCKLQDRGRYPVSPSVFIACFSPFVVVSQFTASKQNFEKSTIYFVLLLKNVRAARYSAVVPLFALIRLFGSVEVVLG